MEKEITELKDKIVFLEALLEINSHSLSKAIETNKLLIKYLKENKN